MAATEIAAVFIANFGFIGLKAFQQRNVMGAHYWLIALTSYLLASVEVYVIWKMAQHGPTLAMVATLGAAGGSGACLATWLHQRHVRPRSASHTPHWDAVVEKTPPVSDTRDTTRDRREAVREDAWPGL